MRTPVYSTQFKRDYKCCQKRNYLMKRLIDVMTGLENEVVLPPQLKEHPLQGDYAGCMECHIEPDWLLIYEIDDELKEVYFIRTGTHSDLF